MTDNITNFPDRERRDLIAEMKGAEQQGNCVNLKGYRIPNITMFDRGDHVDFCLDGRIVWSFSRDVAYDAIDFAATAMAVGAGYPHYEASEHHTQRSFAPKVFHIGDDHE